MRRSVLSLVLLLFLAVCGLARPADSPSLTARDPLRYDGETGTVTATGEATFVQEDLHLVADEIVYDREEKVATATGNVRLSRGPLRLVAAKVVYELESGRFEATDFKLGQPPFYAEGPRLSGDAEMVEMEEPVFYYGDKLPYTPQVYARAATLDPGDVVRLQSVRLRVGEIPLFYAPSITDDLDDEEGPLSPQLRLRGGLDSRFGLYGQSQWLYPLTSEFLAGFNLDAYTKRGLLVGPAAEYIQKTPGTDAYASLDTGYIRDQGDTVDLGRDVLGLPVDNERFFAEFRTLQRYNERFEVTGSVSWWSDSEMTRDFREDDYYEHHQQPDSFLEGAWLGGNWIASAFVRFEPNDFVGPVERLPEVRFDLLPTELIPGTGLYHTLQLSAVRQRENEAPSGALTAAGLAALPPGEQVAYVPIADRFALPGAEREQDRYDALYLLQRPVRLANWLTATPSLGGRVTHYTNMEDSGGLPASIDGDSTRTLWQAGLDLEATFTGTFDVQNDFWEIDGLRHIMKPVVRYRYIPDADDGQTEFLALDRAPVTYPVLPPIDLADIRFIDQLPEEIHVLRFGVENTLQTRAEEGYGSRDLVRWNLLADLDLAPTSQPALGYEGDDFARVSSDLTLTPAPWLELRQVLLFSPEKLNLLSARHEVVVKSADTWEVGLASLFVDDYARDLRPFGMAGQLDSIEEYILFARYKLSERRGLAARLHYDAEEARFLSAEIAYRQRFGQVWDVVYALRYREDDRRRGSTSFSVNLRLVRF